MMKEEIEFFDQDQKFSITNLLQPKSSILCSIVVRPKALTCGSCKAWWSLYSPLVITFLPFYYTSLRMQGEDSKERAEMKEKNFHILKDFMTWVTMLDELGTAGSRLLSGFQQGLEFLRRPPINTESELIRNIIKSNETKRIKFYIEAGCTNSYDIVQNSKVHVCLLGLRDHLSRAKTILNDMETFFKDLVGAVQMSGGCLSPVLNCDSTGPLNQQSSDQLMDHPHSGLEESKMMDCATIMGIIYSMLKQDYLMQERIISSLNLKTSSGELESFCMMWSLRPFINDKILRQAWGLIC